ncbi:MAG TPA: hypothetical protein ACFCUD_06330 [Cyclobacteriaceae bacterium]
MKKIIICITIYLAAISTQAQSVDEILSNYFETTGGMNNWKELESLKMEGISPSPQGEFPITIMAKKPNMLKLVIDVQGKTLIPQAFDGETAWTINPFASGEKAQKLPDNVAEVIREEAQFEDDFIDYQKKGHEVSLEGTEEIDGVECFKIKLVKNKNNDKKEFTEYHFFDTENFVPIMQQSTAQVGPQAGQTQETYLSEYDEVNGLYFPFSYDIRVNGQTISQIQVSSIETNVDIPDDDFAFKP